MTEGCKHPKIGNLQGQIVSPARHYGDGLDGKLVCHICSLVLDDPKKKKRER